MTAAATRQDRPPGLRELDRAGTRSLLVLGLLARLPLPMLVLGTLLYVAGRNADTSGSGWLPAATVSAGLALGAAIGGPLVSRLADRRGHALIGGCATVLLGMLVAVLLLGIGLRLPPPVLVALAVLVGVCHPPIGALSRSRWRVLAAKRDDRAAFESAAATYEDRVEVVGLLAGVVLLGLATALVNPALGLLLALLLALVTQVPFALHRSAVRGNPRRAEVGGNGFDRRLSSAVLLAAAAGVVLSGLVTVIAARSLTVDAAGAVQGTHDLGLLLVLLGVGGVPAAALVARRGTPSAAVGLLAAAVAAVLGLALGVGIALTGGRALTAVLLVLLGGTVGVLALVGYGLLAGVRAARRGGLAVVVGSGGWVGLAVGTVTAARLLGTGGTLAAMLPAVVAAAVAVVVALLASRVPPAS